MRERLLLVENQVGVKCGAKEVFLIPLHSKQSYQLQQYIKSSTVSKEFIRNSTFRM
jgi:hypothetical protein